MLKNLHAEENKQRKTKKICSFTPDSNIDYKQLTNFNQHEPKRPLNMEIVEFMHILMDECTHLLNFDIPFDTELINVIAAKDDAYVLRDGVNDFQSIWTGFLNFNLKDFHLN